jgi:hypothetical protein
LLIRAIIFAIVFFGLGFGLRMVINSYFPELLFVQQEETEIDDTFDQPVPQVNITIDSTGEYAVPELYKTPGDQQELGNIEDLISGHFRSRSEGVDRKKEEGYNNTGVESGSFRESDDFLDTAVFEKTPAEKPVFTPSFGDDSAGLGGLPDLDALAMAFSAGGEPRPAPAPAPREWPQAKEEDTFSFGEDDVLGGIPELGSTDTIAEPFQAQRTEELEQVKTHMVGNKPQPLQGDFDPKELAQGIRTVLSKD